MANGNATSVTFKWVLGVSIPLAVIVLAGWARYTSGIEHRVTVLETSLSHQEEQLDRIESMLKELSH